MAIPEELRAEITTEDLDSLIAEREDLQKWEGSKLDSARSKAVETFKNGKMQEQVAQLLTEKETKIRQEVEAKFNPKKSPAELEIEELKRRLDERDKTEQMNAMKTLVLTEGTKAGISADLITFAEKALIGESEEKTLENLTNLKVLFNKSIDAGVDNRFKEKGKEPGGTKTPGKPSGFKQAMKNGDKKSALRHIMPD